MAGLADFPITARWPAKRPDVIQLYSLPTPNGIKISKALEEMGLAYDAHRIDFGNSDQHSKPFLSLNPNGKIPAIIDPNGPGGGPIGLFESGAILAYLADKTSKLIPADPKGRFETLQWLFFQVGGIGPMFGQLGYFVKYGGKDIEDPRPRARYIEEAHRLLSVLEQRLADRQWIMGDLYTVADIAIFPWIRMLRDSYGAGDMVELGSMNRIMEWFEQALARPASQRGLRIPAATQG